MLRPNLESVPIWIWIGFGMSKSHPVPDWDTKNTTVLVIHVPRATVVVRSCMTVPWRVFAQGALSTTYFGSCLTNVLLSFFSRTRLFFC